MLGFGFLLGFVIAVLPPVVGLIIVAIRGTGRARTLGLIGFAVAAVIGLGTQAGNLVVARIVYELHVSFTAFNLIWSLVLMVLHLVEMIILALAIIASRQSQTAQSAPVPYGYTQPPAAG